ncbi:hypothetical protein DPMN_146243 [Dreissena polymorpha]|uniref:E3 ubiquitin-protein ligase UBR4 N-terminal domain-containing protein n=1 Tax=Dreissena polymorpha TaxID=45954 RepID=A0A9D4F5H6_DREPO|nr:hypothetical protein DPMN_146243 [Dreissena polymorpha]
MCSPHRLIRDNTFCLYWIFVYNRLRVKENIFQSRSSILGQLSSLQEDTLSTRQLEAVSRVMCVSSSRASKVATQLGLVSALPGPVKSAIDMWNSSLNTDFPSMGSWVSD